MKIKEITFQLGNDFHAIMKCEFCDCEKILKSGYNDDFYHHKVIPNQKCPNCDKSTVSGNSLVHPNKAKERYERSASERY